MLTHKEYHEKPLKSSPFPKNIHKLINFIVKYSKLCYNISDSKVINVKKERSNWPVTILMAIILILIGVIAYVLTDMFYPRENHIEKPTTNSELKDVESFAVKEYQDNTKELVALIQTGQEIKLADLSQYNNNIYYDYNGENIYIYLEDSNVGSLYNINLTNGNSNYSLDKIADLPTSITDLDVLDNHIYYLSDNQIYTYDISTNEEKLLNINNNNQITSLYTSASAGSIIYNRNNEIYVYDGSELTNIATGHIEFNLGNKVVYSIKGTNSISYYEYNLTNNSSLLIVSNIPLTYNQIIPYNSGYIYINNDQVMMTNADYVRRLYETDRHITRLILTSANEMYIEIENQEELLKLNMRNLKTNNVTLNYDYHHQIFYR